MARAMITVWAGLFIGGCGGGAPSPAPEPVPDSAARTIAVDTLCKLFEGAGESCVRAGSVVEAIGHTIELEVLRLDEHEQFGLSSLSYRVDLTIDGQPAPNLSSEASCVGSGRDEALKRGFHEWGVVWGVAIADSLFARPDRPALTALGEPLPEMVWAGSLVAYSGYTVARHGSAPLPIDPAVLIAELQPILADLDASTCHGLGLDLAYEFKSTDVHCILDGSPSDRLCELAAGYPWPEPPLTVTHAWVLCPESAPKPPPTPEPAP